MPRETTRARLERERRRLVLAESDMRQVAAAAAHLVEHAADMNGDAERVMQTGVVVTYARPALRRFNPNVPATNPAARPLVWAVDTRHLPMFWFPRDCPRGCIWAASTTTDEDRERFFGQSDATRIHVIETDWLDRMRESRLYAYRLPVEPFSPHEVGGYWVARRPVEAVEQKAFDDLLGLHAAARIELRVTPSIWPFWRSVVSSTVAFSGLRLSNAAPHPQQLR